MRTLCQPDNIKSCAACCGLYNLKDLSRLNLSSFIESGMGRSRSQLDSANTDLYAPHAEIRDDTTYTCPHIGFVGPGRPGCLIHSSESGADDRKKSFYGEKICNLYFCHAHEVLSEKNKKILIETIDDWYLYTIAIIDPESFLWILAAIQDLHFSVEGTIQRIPLIRISLETHGEYLFDRDDAIIHYSLPEYNLAKGEYSLNSDNPSLNNEREEIIEAMKKHIGER